jgi:hypothetical protein
MTPRFLTAALSRRSILLTPLATQMPGRFASIVDAVIRLKGRGRWAVQPDRTRET